LSLEGLGVLVVTVSLIDVVVFDRDRLVFSRDLRTIVSVLSLLCLTVFIADLLRIVRLSILLLVSVEVI
jgi:hypothetical protein